ncbi:MAG: hypothetical protein U9R73_04470 [Pseudomonadota bacterium]|nr:hypothetical protein [Pseudomonadota bacterium]
MKQPAACVRAPAQTSSSVTAQAGPVWRPEHFAAFGAKTCNIEISDPLSNLIPRVWADGTGLSEALPATQQNRASLLALAADESVPIAAVCWSILAWGGMHGRHRDALHGQADLKWLRLAGEIRNGERTRKAAYDAFAALRREKRLAGMGPTFFTKLIFFLMPRQSDNLIGYIMDQWVACSINLLSGRDVVLTDANFHWAHVRKKRKLKSTYIVSDLNDGANYEDYCTKVELVAKEINQSPDNAEWLMMSEGRGLGDWRNYVIQHRQPPYE